jgi:hypothetical protein
MNDISLVYNKKLPTDIKYNVISASIFRLEYNYKSVDKYYMGLKMIENSFQTLFPDFYLFLFYDLSIISPIHKSELINEEIKNKWLPLFSKLNNNPKVRLIRYNHPQFSKGIYHDGLFGVFTRFMPLFDFDISKNINKVIVVDVDVGYHFLKSIKSAFDLFKKSKSQFHFRTHYCYYTRDRFEKAERNLDDKYKVDTWLRILAGSMMSKIKLPKNILNKFISCTKNITSKDCDYIKHFTDVKPSDQDEQYLLDLHDIFKGSVYSYGIDEFFLNTAYLKYLFDNKINLSYTVTTDIHRVLQNLYMRKNKFKNEDTNKYLNDLMKHIMGKYYNKNINLKKNYELLLKIIKNKDAKSYIHINIFNFAVKMINDNNYNKYGFTRKEVKCMAIHDISDKYIDYKLFTEFTSGNKNGPCIN